MPFGTGSLANINVPAKTNQPMAYGSGALGNVPLPTTGQRPTMTGPMGPQLANAPKPLGVGTAPTQLYSRPGPTAAATKALPKPPAPFAPLSYGQWMQRQANQGVGQVQPPAPSAAQQPLPFQQQPYMPFMAPWMMPQMGGYGQGFMPQQFQFSPQTFMPQQQPASQGNQQLPNYYDQHLGDWYYGQPPAQQQQAAPDFSWQQMAALNQILGQFMQGGQGGFGF